MSLRFLSAFTPLLLIGLLIPIAAGAQPLRDAIVANDVAAVRALLKKERGLARKQIGEKELPLHLAVELGQIEIAEALLKAGARINDLDGVRHTPLLALLSELRWKEVAPPEWAARTVRWLLQNRANPNVRTDPELGWGETPLHFAAHVASIEIAELLVAAGADVNSPSKIRETPLSSALSQSTTSRIGPEQVARMARWLLEHGAEANVPDIHGDYPLHKTKDTAVLAVLVAHGASLEVWGEVNYTPLMHAVIVHDSAAVGFLLRAGASPNTSDAPEGMAGEGWRAIHMAIPHDREEETGEFDTINRRIVELLLEHGATVDDDGDNGPLLRATPPSLARMLVARGARIDVVDWEGNTPLHKAIADERDKLALTLIELGAKTDIRNEAGKTALDLATDRGATDLVEAMKQRGGR